MSDPNPPAFPCDSVTTKPTQSGMSLRDWFAGQALAGEMAAQGDTIDSAGSLARRSYLVADAMLAERAKAATS